MLFCIGTNEPAAAHEMSFRGLVLATIPAKSEVVIRHGALLGGPAAITTFRIAPAALRALSVGSAIEGSADADSTPWTVSEIRILGNQSVTDNASSDDSAQTDANASTAVFRNVHHVVVGEYAPTPTLLDELGRPFSLRELRGSSVVMAFVYTRCRDARECPLITARFKALQERFRAEPVRLVEVTLDPAYDRPAVLRTYAKAYGADFSRWSFVTGPPDRVLDFAAQFDVTAFPDERVGLIHPERTVLLDKYGAIRELIDEGAWTPDEIVSEVHHDERLASNPFERLDLWLSSAAVSVCGNAVAGFSGFTDLLTVFAIAAFFGFLLWRVGRGIAKGGI